MKRNHRIGAAVLLLLTAMMLASCSMVFYTGLSGTVKDKDNNGIGNVHVYLYLDKETWESDSASYVKFKPYAPQNYYDHKITMNSGSYAFDKIYWKTASSEYGKEADEIEAYLIFYSDEYGMATETTKIKSETSNSCDKVMELTTDSHSYTVRFQDEKGKTVTGDSISFRWSYEGKPGETEVTTGRAHPGDPIPVRFYKEQGVPELKIYDVRFENTREKDGKDIEEWKITSTIDGVDFTAEKPFVVKGGTDDWNADKTSTESDTIEITRQWFDFNGISGKVVDAAGKPIAGTLSFSDADGHVWSRHTNERLSTDGNMVISQNFAGLGLAESETTGARHTLVVFTGDSPAFTLSFTPDGDGTVTSVSINGEAEFKPVYGVDYSNSVIKVATT